MCFSEKHLIQKKALQIIVRPFSRKECCIELSVAIHPFKSRDCFNPQISPLRYVRKTLYDKNFHMLERINH